MAPRTPAFPRAPTSALPRFHNSLFPVLGVYGFAELPSVASQNRLNRLLTGLELLFGQAKACPTNDRSLLVGHALACPGSSQNLFGGAVIVVEALDPCRR
jgi:hypothetical protein